MDFLLAVHVAHALRAGRDDVQALRGLVDHRRDRIEHLLVAQRLDQMIGVAEQEVQRHHAGLRRDRRGIGRRDDGEVDVAGLHQLQELRLLPELRARILVDQHRALAQFLELGGKHVVGDAVAGIELLIVGEAIMLDLLRAGAGGEHDRRGGDRRTQ